MVIIKYKKINEGMFFSHLNMIRLWNRILAISNIDVNYSQGFNKTRKISFGSPTRVGVESECEYLTIDTDERARDVKMKLENNLPNWLEVVKVFKTDKKVSIAAINTSAKYYVSFDEYKTTKAQIKEFFNLDEIPVKVILHGEEKIIDVKDRIYAYNLEDNGFYVVAGVGDKSVRIDEFVKKMLEFLGKSNNDYTIMKTELYCLSDDGERLVVDELLENIKTDD